MAHCYNLQLSKSAILSWWTAEHSSMCDVDVPVAGKLYHRDDWNELHLKGSITSLSYPLTAVAAHEQGTRDLDNVISLSGITLVTFALE
jgi:hypothetical protein